MRTKPFPKSYLAVSLRSLQTPTHGRYKQQSPALRIPNHLFTSWDIVPQQGSLFTKDLGRITILSPDNLSGEGVVRRSLQARGLLTMPPNLSRALGAPNEVSTPVGVVSWDRQRLAVVTSPQIIAARIGKASLTSPRADDKEVLYGFALDILEGRPRGDIVLDSSCLSAAPSDLMPEIFPELSSSQ